MKKNSAVWIVVLLVFLSAGLYFLQYILFHDWRDTSFYMLQDWAFLPIQVALVTVIAGKIVSDIEKSSRLEKTRLLSSSFFGEMGNDLIWLMEPLAENRGKLEKTLAVHENWETRDFITAAKTIRNMEIPMHCDAKDFEQMKRFLEEKRMTLLVISSNPALLEHESFTDMLWAVFHFTDELEERNDMQKLAKEDRMHLDTDASRVLKWLLVNWIFYLEHLKKEYPYLYRLEAQKNPFIHE